MNTINGTGTRLYGQREGREDASYVATKWFTLLFAPVVPLGSYRVWRGERRFELRPLPGLTTDLHLERVPLRWGQVLLTYLGSLCVGRLVLLPLVTYTAFIAVRLVLERLTG